MDFIFSLAFVVSDDFAEDITASLSPLRDTLQLFTPLRVSTLLSDVLTIRRMDSSLLPLAFWLMNMYGVAEYPLPALVPASLRVISRDLRSMQAMLSLGMSSPFFLSILACRVAWYGALIEQYAKSPLCGSTRLEPLSITSSLPVATSLR